MHNLAESLWNAISMRMPAFAMRYPLSSSLYIWLIFDQVFMGFRLFYAPKMLGFNLAIMRGGRPPRPPYKLQGSFELDDVIWNLINQCWHLDPKERPTVHEVVAILSRRMTVDFRPAPDWDNFRFPCSCVAHPGQFLLSSRSHKE
jgi:hypothetical protein